MALQGTPLLQSLCFWDVWWVNGDAGGVEAGQGPAIEVAHSGLLDGQDWPLLRSKHLQHMLMLEADAALTSTASA